MKKCSKILVLVLMLLSAFALPFSAQNAAAAENDVSVYMPYGENSRSLKGRLIDDTTYLPLRSFSDESGAISVTWNAHTRTATVVSQGLICKVTDGKPYIIANERVIYSGRVNYIENGKMYVPSRSICKAFGFLLYWNSEKRSVEILNSNGPIEHGDSYYDWEDLYWLSRIISCEAGETEPLIGQIAVGNVVLNRVEDPSSPNTVFDVIFDNRYGIQFTPAYTPKIYAEPTESAVIAAKICLEGFTVSEDALFFYAPKYVYAAWIENNREYLFTIGGHKFFS